jgi:hypothetical protein
MAGATKNSRVKLPEKIKISKIILTCIVAMASINPAAKRFISAEVFLLSAARDVETAVLETREPKKDVMMIDFFLLKYLSKK